MATYTPGPPLLFSLSRYSAEEGWRIVISGRNLDVCDYVAVGRIRVPASDVTVLSHHRIAIVVPAGATTNTITVASPRGSDTSKFRLIIKEPDTGSSPSPAPSSPAPSEPPASSSPSAFNLEAAMGAFGGVIPRPFRSFFHSASNVWRAFETARSSTPFATGGDWFNYSTQNSDYNKWNRTRERARDYSERARTATTDAERDRWQRMADKAGEIATQRGQAAAGSAVVGGATGAAIGQGVGTSGILSGIGGAIGSAWGPVGQAAGAAIGSAIEMVIKKVFDDVKKTIANVREGYDLGGKAVDFLTSGVKTHFNALRETGEGIVSALMEGVSAHLGPSGPAITRFGNQFTRWLGGMFERGFDGATGALKGAGKVVGAGVVGASALAVGAVGAAFASIGNMGLLSGMGFVMGAAIGSTIGLLLMKVVVAVSEMAGKVLAAFGKMFGEIGQLAVGFLRTVLDVMQAAKTAIMEYSRAVYDLSSHSGQNFTVSQNIINSRLAFGMQPNETAGIYGRFNQMPIFQNAMKAAFGIRGEAGSDEEFRSILDQGRRLPLMLRRIMFQNMPEGEDFWLKLVGMPQQKVDSQLAFFKNMNLGGGAIKGAAEDLFLLQSRWEGFVQFLYRTVGAALLPMFTTALTGITNFLKANQGNIQGWIMNVGQWFFVQLPSFIGKGIEVVLTMIGTLINGIDAAMTALRHNIKPILDFLDGVLNGIRKVVINMLAAFAAMAAGPLLAIPTFFAWRLTLGQIIPQSQMGQNYAFMNSAVGTLGRAQRAYRQNFLNPANRMLSNGISYAQGLQNSQAQRQQTFDDFQKQTAQNTAQTAQNTARIPDATGAIVGDHLREAMMEIIGVALRNSRRDDFYAARRA